MLGADIFLMLHLRRNVVNTLTVLNASAPRSFTQAKHIVYQIFSSHPKTLYCGCRFDSKHQVDLNSCHMNSAIDKKRAHKVEIEHMATDY